MATKDKRFLLMSLFAVLSTIPWWLAFYVFRSELNAPQKVAVSMLSIPFLLLAGRFLRDWLREA